MCQHAPVQQNHCLVAQVVLEVQWCPGLLSPPGKHAIKQLRLPLHRVTSSCSIAEAQLWIIAGGRCHPSTDVLLVINRNLHMKTARWHLALLWIPLTSGSSLKTEFKQLLLSTILMEWAAADKYTLEKVMKRKDREGWCVIQSIKISSYWAINTGSSVETV